MWTSSITSSDNTTASSGGSNSNAASGNISNTNGANTRSVNNIGSNFSINTDTEITGIMGDMNKVKNYQDIVMTVYPKYINTTTIFNIWKPIKSGITAINATSSTASDTFNYDINGELTFKKLPSRNKEYKVISKVPIIYSDELKTVLNSNRRNFVKKDYVRYLQLPDSLPQRVRVLANNISNKYNNQFEKAAAIEEYLRNTYPYSLETSPIPDGRDFVDYFLFDEKKGYCTYFASSMVIMSRAVGIPARYVEGFVLDDSNKDTNGLYSATSNKAHAWVELYFDGFGWIRFEPTASFSPEDFKRPDVNASSAVSSIDRSGEQTDNTDANNKNKAIDKVDDAGISAIGIGNKGNKVYPYIIASILLILLARVGGKIYASYLKIRSADSLGGREAAMEYLYILENNLKLAGLNRGVDETAFEYGVRIDPYLSSYDIDIKNIMGLFDGIRFGNNIMDKDIRVKFRQTIKKTDKFIRDEKGIIKYLTLKYIL